MTTISRDIKNKMLWLSFKSDIFSVIYYLSNGKIEVLPFIYVLDSLGSI